MLQKTWNVCVPDGSGVSMFAAEEFARLMGIMDPEAAVEVSACAYEPAAKALWIGLDEALPKAPQVEDPVVDDSIYIDVAEGAGVITGVNERSVLLGVYRFFREVGCVFVRPGRDGEYVPGKDSMSLSVKVCETPAYRHRGICLEGSNSYENVVDMIDWAPKVGFNAYYTQLFRPAFTFDRWYGHQSNPSVAPTPISKETIDSFVKDYSVQVEKRGMLHHRIGHGWASKLLGIISGAWHEMNDESEVLPGRQEIMAVINGERRLFEGSGIDTNLCYSNPKVQQMLADEVVAYAKEHPETRYLHFWLADQPNNQCECEACKVGRPSDHYVDMLNKIDAQLTAEGLDTKIVFLIYLDLLWEPERAVLNNQDRFVLMFAPIRRSYSVPMASDKGKKAAPYVRNGFVLTTDAGGTLPYLEAWQKMFKGDSFIFDYHYMWDYINDPGCFKSVQTMAKDVEDFKELGLNGFMSCQNQRVFMPNGLGMNVMGNALWTGTEDFEKVTEPYFEAAYGEAGTTVMTFMELLSDMFDPLILRGEKPVETEEAAEKYAKIPELIDAFLPTIEKNRNGDSEVHRRSWECLAFYVELCRKTSKVVCAAARGEREEMDALWKDARKFVCDNELRFQKELDVFEFLNIWENKILYRFREQSELFIE